MYFSVFQVFALPNWGLSTRVMDRKSTGFSILYLIEFGIAKVFTVWIYY